MTECNPNGANQFKPDPRQTLFLTYYFDQKSETFSNAYQSAKKAGYEDEYCQNITAQMPKWLSESIRDNDLVKKAERNLNEFLEMETVNIKTNDKGEELSFVDAGLTRVKADMTKFALERLNKAKYSARQELAGINNSQLLPTQIEIVEVKQ